MDLKAERSDQVEMAEDTEISHRNYLVEFEEKVWPVFQVHGYAKDTALAYWLLNRIENKLDAIAIALGVAEA